MTSAEMTGAEMPPGLVSAVLAVPTRVETLLASVLVLTENAWGVILAVLLLGWMVVNLQEH